VSLLIKGVTNFLGLTDTPASFAGQSGKLPVVKSVEDALEFLDVLAITLLTEDLHIIDDFTNWTKVENGGSVATQGLTRAKVDSVNVAGGEAMLYDSLFLTHAGGSLVDNMNWDKACRIFWAAQMDGAGIGNNIWSFIRYASGSHFGALAQIGVGFRYKRSGYTLYAESHDGAVLEMTEISTGFSLHDKLHLYEIKHTPGVKVEFYLDNVLKATHITRIPSGSVGAVLSVGAENLAIDQSIEMTVNRIIFEKDWD